MAAHDQAVESGSLTYQDPVSGLTVMTRTFLENRGYCCDSGCRHCPYLEGGLDSSGSAG